MPPPRPYTRAMDNSLRFALTALAALALNLVPACSPKVQIDIGRGPERKLVATTVLSDKEPGPAKVAMIDVRGLLADAERPDLFGQGINPVDRFVTLLSLAENDPAVA